MEEQNIAYKEMCERVNKIKNDTKKKYEVANTIIATIMQYILTNPKGISESNPIDFLTQATNKFERLKNKEGKRAARYRAKIAIQACVKSPDKVTKIIEELKPSAKLVRNHYEKYGNAPKYLNLK